MTRHSHVTEICPRVEDIYVMKPTNPQPNDPDIVLITAYEYNKKVYNIFSNFQQKFSSNMHPLSERGKVENKSH